MATNVGKGGIQLTSPGVEGPMALDAQGCAVTVAGHGDWYEIAKRGNLFQANAIITAPVIFTTAAGTGGPLIWNPLNSGYNVALLAVSFGLTVASTVVAALGITGNTGQTSAPTSTTAIDSNKNLLMGGRSPSSQAFRVGTPTNAGNFLMTFGDLDTGAITTTFGGMNWVELKGGVIAPPGTWVSVAEI